jgi:micrococcal nuclease
VIPSYTYRAVVEDVYDGDTVTLTIDLGMHVHLRRQKVRLIGIDAPEVRGDSRAAGLTARDFLRSLLPVGAAVVVETEKDRAEKYGRWLARIWAAPVGGGDPALPVSVADAMVEAGHAVRWAQ